ncbi:MAG TPA: DUF1028 domain-containing protein [Anaerolineales bacterium]|nr:DUF1028 domain-containing protein [Anaerolineales bacterium]
MRPAHTYSIVAYDSSARQWGVAVQTHWFGVGTGSVWAEGGVGVVATQSLTDPAYGPLGLQLMRGGKNAAEALRALLAADARSEVRQVAMIDGEGGLAVHTGEKCIGQAGHRLGPGYSVQANTMLRSTVWDAMAEAFERNAGDLAERMLQALEAAEAEGGDIRGRQSAALVVVGAEPRDRPWASRLVDVRVDDHPQPLPELRRLTAVSRLYHDLDQATDALDARPLTDDGLAAARGAFERVRVGLASIPGNVEPIVWYAVALVNAGRVEESLPLFAEVYRVQPVWKDVMGRLAASGLLKVEPEALGRIAEA